jgi:uncharacterized membrane protein
VAFCPTCGAQIADGTTCPKCTGHTTNPAAPAAGGLSDNVAGLLAYVTIIPAIVFLLIEPYNKNRFVRFHSFQSIFFSIAWFVIRVGLAILGFVSFLWTIVHLAFFVVWIILILKAYQGQMYKLPVIGDLAAQQAGQ